MLIEILNLIAHSVIMFICYWFGYCLVGAWFGAIFNLSEYLVRNKDMDPKTAGKVVDLLAEGVGWIFVLWYGWFMLSDLYERGYESISFFS